MLYIRVDSKDVKYRGLVLLDWCAGQMKKKNLGGGGGPVGESCAVLPVFLSCAPCCFSNPLRKLDSYKYPLFNPG